MKMPPLAVIKDSERIETSHFASILVSTLCDGSARRVEYTSFCMHTSLCLTYETFRTFVKERFIMAGLLSIELSRLHPILVAFPLALLVVSVLLDWMHGGDPHSFQVPG